MRRSHLYGLYELLVFAIGKALLLNQMLDVVDLGLPLTLRTAGSFVLKEVARLAVYLGNHLVLLLCALNFLDRGLGVLDFLRALVVRQHAVGIVGYIYLTMSFGLFPCSSHAFRGSASSPTICVTSKELFHKVLVIAVTILRIRLLTLILV